MPYRGDFFELDEYYHVYNRGNNRDTLCFDDRDRIRLLFLLLYLQSSVPIRNIGRHITPFEKTGVFKVKEKATEEIIRHREVELVAFVIMDNHLHTILCEKKEGGISNYMKRVQGAYAMYFNEKYKNKHVGHVFQGRFKATHQESNGQILHTSAYIHRNPKELRGWNKKEKQYPYSSYQDYIGENRWKNLLVTDILSGQFDSAKDYENFADTSTAKDLIFGPNAQTQT